MPSPEVIPLDATVLPTTGNYTLRAGVIYELTRTKQFTCTFVKIGDGANPIIRYKPVKLPTTGLPQDVLSCPLGHSAGLINIDIDAPAWCFAVSSEGAVNWNGGHFSGGCGAFRGAGCSGANVINNTTQLTESVGYVCYFAGKTIQDDAKAFVQRQAQSLTLTNNNWQLGSQYMHVRRYHCFKSITEKNNKFGDPDKLGAVLRAHDGESFNSENNINQGDVDFAPMDGGDGGIAIPVGTPKRNAYEAMRLKALVSVNDRFICKVFKISTGLLSGRFDSTYLTCSSGGSLIQTPAPYMTRPLSVAKFTNLVGIYQGAQANDHGKLFACDQQGHESDGAKNIRVAGIFNGKACVH